MSIKSLWRNARSDFAQNKFSSKLAAGYTAAITPPVAAAAVSDAVGHKWDWAAAFAVATASNIYLLRTVLRGRSARASPARPQVQVFSLDPDGPHGQ